MQHPACGTPLRGGSRQQALKHLKHSEALQPSAQDAAALVLAC